MKPFTHEDLITYHLNELPENKVRALEEAMQADSELAEESTAYANTLRICKADVPLVADEALLSRSWQTLLPKLAPHRAALVFPTRWRWPAFAGVGLAFAAVVLFATHRRWAESRVPIRPSQVSHTSVTATSDAEVQPVHSRMAITPTLHERSPLNRALLEHSVDSVAARPSVLPSVLKGIVRPIPNVSATPSIFIPLATMTMPELPATSSTSVVDTPVTVPESGAHWRRSTAKRNRNTTHHVVPTDVTFAMGGTLIGTRSVNNTPGETNTVGASHSIIAQGSFHQQIHSLVGYRVAVSYTRLEFQYVLSNPISPDFGGEVNSRIYELAATYVIRGPSHGRLGTSAEAGAGVMGLLPTVSTADTSYNIRGSAVAGVAASYELTKHLGLHAGYRFQAFKSPDFQYSGINKPLATTTLFSNEPTFGITYRFHSK